MGEILLHSLNEAHSSHPALRVMESCEAQEHKKKLSYTLPAYSYLPASVFILPFNQYKLRLEHSVHSLITNLSRESFGCFFSKIYLKHGANVGENISK